ncbi:capsid protein [Embleya sp. NPDC059237]|uniref:capsid protein n=1 Tax=Embleya sp. NPDC059237 TaxID=3346784 RepID=UPI003686505C
MPLPEGGKTPWPPRALAGPDQQIAVWDAWYRGDPDEISSLYGGARSYAGAAGDFFGSESGRPGLLGRARTAFTRWFWGTRLTPGEQRTKYHVPLPADICKASAQLLYSEPPTALVGDSTTQARLDELMDDGMHAVLAEAAELEAARGGGYLRVVWDRNMRPRPWIASASTRHAVPEWRWGELAAVTFWRVLHCDGDKVRRHLERHERGVILHGLYDGTRDTLGLAVGLEADPATAGLKPAVPTGLKDRLTAVYVPNMRPTIWEDNPAAAHLGRSDLHQCEPLFDGLDETLSSWMRDVRQARGRLIVPESMLESQGPGKGAVFDQDREIYSGLNILQRAGGTTDLTIVQFAIRVAEHRDTCDELTELTLRAAGYSSQTFGGTGDAAMTATEVNARERRSFITRDRKILYQRPAISEILETLLMVDALMIGTRGIVPERPSIAFGDSVSEDMLTLANTAEVLHRAQAASTDALVRLVHPDWAEPQIAEEVDRIHVEFGLVASDPTEVGADPVTEPPDPEPTYA